MSWLFSRALVAAFSADTCLDGAPSAPLSVMPTPHKFWRNDKTMEPSQLSQFGLTCAVLTEDRGEALLTWFLAGFPARTSAQPEKAPESRANDPAFGLKWHALSVKYDLDSSTWRIHHSLFPEDLSESSVILPRWGLMLDGELWERTTSVPLTSVTDAGLWQTPVADDAAPRKNGKHNSRGEPKLSAQVLLLPTPTATNAMQGTSSKAGGSSNGRPLLPMAAMTWPTPRASDGAKGGPNQRGSKGDLMLSSAVHMWPTPTVNDSKNSTLPPSQINHDNIPGALLRNGEPPGGSLNPTWVEWLMGWPPGWTDLKPLAMDKFQQWRQQHGA